MSGQEVIQKLEQYASIPRDITLQRMSQLLHELGNPQTDLRFVHVGGTNGKGSVSAMLYAIYNRCEYRAGLFTSPHLYSIHERIQVNGVNISDNDFALFGEEVLKAAERMVAEGKEHPSQLELSFAIALLYFLAKDTEVVLLEVVKGGRDDVTNVIGVPVLTILTNIDDATHEIGSTEYKDYVLELAGIIKTGSKVVLYQQNQEVIDVVTGVCRNLSVPLSLSRPKAVKKIGLTPSSQKFSVDNQFYQISLTGDHQLENVALVLEAVSVLKESGFGFSQKEIFAGLSRTVWPGRFERVHISPDFILDGCHNLQSVQAVLTTLSQLYPEKSIIFVLGFHQDSEYSLMIEELLPVGKRFITVTANHPKAMSGTDLAGYLQGKTPYPVFTVDSVKDAVETAMEIADADDVVCALGSLHIVGEIRNTLGLC